MGDSGAEKGEGGKVLWELIWIFISYLKNHAHISTLPICLWMKVVLSQSLHLLDRETQNYNVRVCVSVCVPQIRKWDKLKLLWFLVFFKTRRSKYSVWQRLILFIVSNHIIISKQTQSVSSWHLLTPGSHYSSHNLFPKTRAPLLKHGAWVCLLNYSHLRETVSPRGGSG